MTTSNFHPITSYADVTTNPAEPPRTSAGPQDESPDPSRVLAAMASGRILAAIEYAWELGEERFTAAECAAMSLQPLRRLCDEAFTALDADFPAWGARDEYEVLCAELAARAKAPRDRPASAHD